MNDPYTSANASPGSWILRLALGAFGLPFLSVGFFIVSMGVVGLFSGNATLAGLFGIVFGAPFFAIGALLIVAAIKGPSIVTDRVRGRARNRLESVQQQIQRAAAEARAQAGGAEGQRTGEGPTEMPSLAVLHGALKDGRYARCPECDSPITDASLISPSGDVRCEYCRSWFNAHKG